MSQHVTGIGGSFFRADDHRAHALLKKLEADGVRIDPKRMDEDYGRFAWVYDPEGNKIELWEPKA